MNRLIAVQQDIDPPPETASVSEIRKGSIAILENKGQPTHRMDLLKELADSGIRVGGKVPVNTLGSILSRFDKDFKPHGQGIWGLKAWDSGPSSSESPTSNGHAAGPFAPVKKIPFPPAERIPRVVVKEEIEEVEDLPW